MGNVTHHSIVAIVGGMSVVGYVGAMARDAVQKAWDAGFGQSWFVPKGVGEFVRNSAIPGLVAMGAWMLGNRFDRGFGEGLKLGSVAMGGMAAAMAVRQVTDTEEVPLVLSGLPDLGRGFYLLTRKPPGGQ